MASEKELIEVLIIDSVGFLKNVPVQNIARNAFTVNEVISEVRSAAVRERLAVLPYEINFRVPSNDSLHVVSEFAKKTGDFKSLSLVDLKVLALTYQLHKEKCGTEDLRIEPTKQVEMVGKRLQGKMPGFFVNNKKRNCENEEEATNDDENINEKLPANDEEEKLAIQLDDCLLNENDIKETIKDTQQLTNALKNPQTENGIAKENRNLKVKNDKNNGFVVNENRSVVEDVGNDVIMYADKKDTFVDVNDHKHDGDHDHKEHDDNCSGNDHNDIIDDDDDDKDDDDKVDDDDDKVDDDDDDDDNDDDDGDWITPDNITQVKADMGVPENEVKPTHVVVGCLTTDFAMQNVLIQMGLHVISVDGMLIKEARSYVLKCHSCFKVTTQMQRLFCPQCGNRTLLKVSVSVDDQGVTHYHMPQRKKPFNIRGKKHPLPLPKGGRHSNNPLLFEDQLISQKRLPKVKDKVNVLGQDYVARSSPFSVNDTTSRAFNLGFHVHGQNRRNPNEAQKKTRRKKK